MHDSETYSNYLRGRKPAAKLYFRFLVYPRICRFLTGRILDVGCGIGDFMAYRANTTGLDINPHNVEYCRIRGLEAFLIENDRYPFDNNSFDGAVMDNVLEHLADPTPTLSEIHRVLKPHGTLIAGVPGKRGFAHDPDHKEFYDEKRVVDRMQSAGFTVKKLIHMPLFKSDWLSKRLRQYCIYGVFERF